MDRPFFLEPNVLRVLAILEFCCRMIVVNVVDVIAVALVAVVALVAAGAVVNIVAVLVLAVSVPLPPFLLLRRQYYFLLVFSYWLCTLC